jgi:hypothetical protein
MSGAPPVAVAELGASVPLQARVERVERVERVKRVRRVETLGRMVGLAWRLEILAVKEAGA